MDPARREPGPGLPPRGRPRSRTASSTPNWAPGWPGCRASASAQSSRSCSASTSPRSTPPRTGPPGRCRRAWLVYAALDVELLVDLRDKVARAPRRRRKDSTSPAQEFAAVLAHETEPFQPTAWRRLSGVHSLSGPRNLAVARELWEARGTTTPGRSTPRPGGSCPTPRSSPRPRRLPRIQARSRRNSRSSPGGPAARSSTAGGTRSRAGSEHRGPAHASGYRRTGMPPARIWSDRIPRRTGVSRLARAAMAEVSTRAAHPGGEPADPREPAPGGLGSAGADSTRNRSATPWPISGADPGRLTQPHR